MSSSPRAELNGLELAFAELTCSELIQRLEALHPQLFLSLHRARRAALSDTTAAHLADYRQELDQAKALVSQLQQQLAAETAQQLKAARALKQTFGAFVRSLPPRLLTQAKGRIATAFQRLAQMVREQAECDGWEGARALDER